MGIRLDTTEDGVEYVREADIDANPFRNPSAREYYSSTGRSLTMPEGRSASTDPPPIRRFLRVSPQSLCPCSYAEQKHHKHTIGHHFEHIAHLKGDSQSRAAGGPGLIAS